jgi:Zn2+/Cd2+-exporting ATPase
MTETSDCEPLKPDDAGTAPAGVLGVHLAEDESLEIRFDPKQLDDAEVEAFARSLAPPRMEKCLFRLNGRACEACALKIEKRTAAIEGVRKASATFVGGVMSVGFDDQLTDRDRVLATVRAQGTAAEPWTDETPAGDRVEIAFTVITLVAILVAWFLPAAQTPAMIVAYFTGGTFGIQAAWQSLKEKTVDVDLLMILAALGAAYVGAPIEGAVLLFLFSFSNVLQSFAIDQTRKAIHSLMKLRPDKALARRDGELVLLDLDDLVVDDTVVVRPGESIPLDGVIIEGSTSIDESSLTGESMPVSKASQDPVFAGTINQTGSIEFRVTRLAKDSTIAKLVQMVEEAQSEKASTQRWLDQAEQYYAAGVILFTLALIAVPVAMGSPFDSTFYRAITVMVVASPCALVISTPASILSAIGGAARRGVLFKGGAHLERAAEIDVICFDKTGTLTEGKPKVTDLVVDSVRYSLNDDFSKKANELLTLAASVEQKSEHPLAAAIVSAAKSKGLTLAEANDFQSVSGKGAQAHIGERLITIGSPRMLAERKGMAAHKEVLEELQEQGKTAILLADEDTILGIVAVADVLRSDAITTLKALRETGIKRLVMVTGDNQRVAEAIAKQVGIDEVFADLLPQDKVSVIKQLKEEHRVAMVGDGVNDAPALAISDLGIAMGAAGTDVALESADMVIMGERLEQLPFAFAISRRARRIMIGNLSFALGVILILVAFSLFGTLPLPLGVLGHEGSTVLVCLSGLRLLFHRPHKS